MGLGALLRSAAETVRHTVELRRTGSEIAFLNQRWRHHGRRSGYLIDVGLGPSVARDDRLLPHPFVRWRMARTGEERWEQTRLLWLSLALARTKLLHLVDGDFDAWAYAPRPSWLSTRITATFHQPVDRLGEIARAIRPGALDGIVCMSGPQLPLLERLVPPGRCVFIPHGVDTEFFAPKPEPEEKRPVVLSVGAHRRDFPTLIGVARTLRARRPEAVVRLIAPPAAADAVKRDGAAAVETLSGIGDEELLAQYRAAAVVLLPLEAATANNALLEAMACARPIVVTDLADLRDYATEAAAWFAPPGDVAAHADAVLALLDDPERRARMAAEARAEALGLAWPAVRARALAFFRDVIAS
jgi:glycosyltransferase involved in cell wall biosynthesis